MKKRGELTCAEKRKGKTVSFHLNTEQRGLCCGESERERRKGEKGMELHRTIQNQKNAQAQHTKINYFLFFYIGNLGRREKSLGSNHVFG